MTTQRPSDRSPLPKITSPHLYLCTRSFVASSFTRSAGRARKYGLDFSTSQRASRSISRPCNRSKLRIAPSPEAIPTQLCVVHRLSQKLNFGRTSISHSTPPSFIALAQVAGQGFVRLKLRNRALAGANVGP